MFEIWSKYLYSSLLDPFVRKWCFSKISNCLLWPPCYLINLKITESVDLIDINLHTKFGENPTFRLTVMKRQSLNFEHSSWQPCSFFGKTVQEDSHLFLKIYTNCRKIGRKIFILTYFLKKWVKKACFSWFSGNPVDGFFPKSNQFCYNGKYTFVSNFVIIGHSVRELSCVRTSLPPLKKCITQALFFMIGPELKSDLTRFFQETKYFRSFWSESKNI